MVTLDRNAVLHEPLQVRSHPGPRPPVTQELPLAFLTVLVSSLLAVAWLLSELCVANQAEPVLPALLLTSVTADPVPV